MSILIARRTVSAAAAAVIALAATASAQQPGQQDRQRQGQDRQRPGQDQGRGQDRLVKATGEITNIKRMSPPGTDAEFIIAAMKTEGGKRVTVNLGPSQRYKDVNFESGDKVTVFGKLMRIGDQPVILAHRVQTGDRTVQVTSARQGEQARQGDQARQGGQGDQARRQQQPGDLFKATGQVTSVKQAKLPGMEQQTMIVGVRTQGGNRLTVNLGPVSEVRNLDLQQGDKVTVRGRLMRIGEQRILAAHQIQSGEQSVQIRADRRQQQRQPMQQQTRDLQGTIERVKQVEVRGTDRKNTVVLLNTERGKVVVDLGPTSDLKSLRVAQDKKLDVTGRSMRVGDKTVVLAEEATIGGRTVDIQRPQPRRRMQDDRMQDRERQPARQDREAGERQIRDRQAAFDQGTGAQGRQVRGQVGKMKQVGVRGTDTRNMVVLLTAEDGTKYVVDLGPAQDLRSLRIAEGDWLAVQGDQVRVGDRPVLMARRMTMDGESRRIRRQQPTGEGQFREAEYRQR